MVLPEWQNEHMVIPQMQSTLRFYQYESDLVSNCGDVLNIEFSSQALNWSGIIIEKGSSPHFHPTNVYTPYFYFALALDEELHWQVEDKGSLTALKTTPGNIWINPPKTPFTHDINEPCYFIILAIEEQRFLDACPLKLPQKPLSFLNNYNVMDETIKGILELFLLEAKAKGSNGKAYLDNLLSLLTTHYIKHYSNYHDLLQPSSDSKFDQYQIDKVDKFIVEHIGEPITVDDLANIIGCSKYYFLREFKKFTGVTPYQYLLAQKLEQAKTWFKQNNTNIASISHELGFNDQSHFTKAFKAQYGKTPGQFIKDL